MLRRGGVTARPGAPPEMDRDIYCKRPDLYVLLQPNL